jgi:penicillin-binding protein 1A
LAKNTVGSWETTWRRKIREAAIAFQIESQYSKDEILQSYLNTIFFGQSIYGAETAAQSYFRKPAEQLTLSEAATLAAIIRLPNVYSPYNNIEHTTTRRNLVIKTMLELEMISNSEAAEAIASKITVSPPHESKYPYPYFVEHVKQEMLNDSAFGSTVSDRTNWLFQGGLRIYTTIDPKMQQAAEDAVWGTLNQSADPVGSLVAIEPSTGYIRALVGGKDWETDKFNLAVQAKRQPGSAFKPFVLATALENGISISKTYNAGPAVIKLPNQNWEVNNSGRSGGTMALRDATIYSVNSVFARLIMDVGPTAVVEQVKRMGIKSRVEPVPAIALGGLGGGVSPLEMATAYSTFANNGQHARPIAITKVTDSNGEVLKTNGIRMLPAMDPVTAYLVTDALSGVIRSGTGRAASIGRPAAGKTGTTEEYGDAWFVGFTPDLVAAVWVGYKDSRRPMRNVHGITVQGGTFPAQIWRKFMIPAMAGIPAKNFPRPAKGIVGILVDSETGDRATEFCPETTLMQFAAGTGPLKVCEVHVGPEVLEMPNIVGLPAAEAKEVLETAGLQVKISEVDTLAVPAGSIAAQLPLAGTELETGDEVEMQVSTGRPETDEIEVPKVVGLLRVQGENLMRDAGLKFTVIWVPVSGDGQVGKVVGQLPPAGTLVKPTVEVIIRVGQKAEANG